MAVDVGPVADCRRPAHLADEFIEMGVLAPSLIGRSPVVSAFDVADARAVFARGDGRRDSSTTTDMFWGDRHGTRSDIAAASLSSACATFTGFHLHGLPTAGHQRTCARRSFSWNEVLR